MDGAASWRPTPGADPNSAAPAGVVDPFAGYGGFYLHPNGRAMIVDKLLESLKKHQPVLASAGPTERQELVRLEEEIYTAATSRSDYVRKVSQTMLHLETRSRAQHNPGNAQVVLNQYPLGPAPGLSPQGSNPAHSSAIPLMYQQQTRQPNASTPVQGCLPSGL